MIGMAKEQTTWTPKRIKALRHKLKLTQTEAANKVKVTLRTWQYWESGEKPPTGAMALLLDQLSSHPSDF